MVGGKTQARARLAFEELPFYRERFTAAGFDPANSARSTIFARADINKEDLLASASSGSSCSAQVLHRGSRFAR